MKCNVFEYMKKLNKHVISKKMKKNAQLLNKIMKLFFIKTN